jgi:hypothetical protein
VTIEFAPIKSKAPPDLGEISLPPTVLLKPAVRLGKRLLPLQSCKVTLAGLDATFAHKSDGTLATFGKGASVPKAGSYAVRFIQGPDTAAVCRGLAAEEPVVAAKLGGLGQGAELSIPAGRPGSRAFAGIVSLPKDLRSKAESWRSALEALRDVFEAGAKEGRYLWGAVYGPDGKALVRSESADYAPLDIEREVLKSAATMEQLRNGTGLMPFDTLVDLVATDVADLEGNVDMLVVAQTIRTICGWFPSPLADGGRAALIRFALFSASKGSKEVAGMPGVRLCDYREGSDKRGVVAEVEVVHDQWPADALPHLQLKRVISGVAASLLKR